MATLLSERMEDSHTVVPFRRKRSSFQTACPHIEPANTGEYDPEITFTPGTVADLLIYKVPIVYMTSGERRWTRENEHGSKSLPTSRLLGLICRGHITGNFQLVHRPRH